MYGVVAELSSIKKSTTDCQYFQVQLSDGTKSIKVVAFDSSLCLFMDTSHKDWKAIKLMNCRVQKKQNKEDAHISQ